MSSVQRYEIFQKLSCKQATWVETATSLEDAMNRLNELTLMFPADYFILDCENSHFIVPFRCQGSERQRCLMF
jgi:hypothetical protein